jgi:glutamyl-tRNA synthetase
MPWNNGFTLALPVQTPCIGEMAMANIKENDLVQIMRRGYFRCDKPYRGEHSPLILFQIPDGKQKAMSALSTKLSHR